MIYCVFHIFNNCNWCINYSITLSLGWFFSLYSIHLSKKKWTFISIERNIWVIFSKPVYIIGWWTDIDYFINGNIGILECITDIKNPGSDSMHSHNINFDSEGFRMCHRTLELIKINTFNLITPIFTVMCNKFPFIVTVAFFNTWRN